MPTVKNCCKGANVGFRHIGEYQEETADSAWYNISTSEDNVVYTYKRKINAIPPLKYISQVPNQK